MTHAAAALPAPAHRTMAREWVRGNLFSAAALALLASLVFANALANGFVLDDRGIILGNPLVQNFGNTWRAFTLPYWPEALGGGQYRPLAILHFALDWRLSGGDPAWFHAVNVMWHALATVLVWRLVALLMQPRMAFIAAALFAVHPVHVEAVANVVGRLELMATVFTLGALLAHRASHWLAILFFALGLLSKENAIVFLGLAAAQDVLLRPQTSDLRPRKRLYAGYAVVLLLYAAIVFLVFNDRPFHVVTGTLDGEPLGTRLWTMAKVVPEYVRLLLFPASLSADYEPQVIRSANGLTLAGAAGLLCVAAYIGALVITWKRNRALALALGWVGIAVAPVANVFFVSGVTLAERSLYLPSVGVVLALGIVVDSALARRNMFVYAAVAALTVAGALRTWTRTPAWHDDRAYVLTLLADHPESYRGHWVAARAYRAAGRLPEAHAEFTMARRLFPRSRELYSESATLAAAMGSPREAQALSDTAAQLARRR